MKFIAPYIFCFIVGIHTLIGQTSSDGVGIGTVSVASDAILEVESNNKGILVPRVTTTQRNQISAVSEGLIVYDKTVDAFYYYSGSEWLRLITQPELDLKLNLTGGTLTGNLNMSSNKVTNVGNGTNTADAVNKGQLDEKLNLSGGTLTGNLSMNSNKITNLASPTVGTDAARYSNITALDNRKAEEGAVLTDFNNYTDAGIYFAGGSFASNQPNQDDFYTMIVTSNGSIIDQLCITNTSTNGGRGDIWFRRKNGSWGAWTKIK
ncbi:hypothetical protein [Marinoscillum sp.]|uniref:hypothetical protein n=1 Tax=Marinoscillum sp. TaxID=2024838 RepID=UPI003BAD3799